MRTLRDLEDIRAALETREGTVVEGDDMKTLAGHPINYPFYVVIKAQTMTAWFKVTGVNKGDGYTGYQVTEDAGKKTPSKAVTKTIPKGTKGAWKHVPAHQVPENIMKRFDTKPDGGMKIGGNPDAKVTVKAGAADKKESTIEKIRSQVMALIKAWDK